MSQETTLLSHDELMSEVRGLSHAKKTGTILIATPQNQLARIVLKEGEIVDLTFGTKHGTEAVPLLQQIETGMVKFSENKVGQYDEVQYPPIEELLTLLSTGRNLQPAAQTSSSAGSVKTGAIPSALKIIENELIEFLGPIASIVWEEQLNKSGYPSQADDLIHIMNELAKEISDPNKASQFKSRVTEKLSNL